MAISLFGWQLGRQPAEPDASLEVVERAMGAALEAKERLAALEFAMETYEWRVVRGENDRDFSRSGLRNITDMARTMYIKNPLIKRGVNVKRFYVWGQGWTIRAQQPEIQKVIDAFLYGQKNDDVFGSHEARMQLEIELETDGNLFFAFFINSLTGTIRLRTIPFDEIEDVLYNPNDRKDPWFYQRRWQEVRIDYETGGLTTYERVAYYPDWRYTPLHQPEAIGPFPIHWESPIYHIKTGGFSNWKFGISEVYDAIDWARAYKLFLEDWASIVRSYRKFAWQLTAPTKKDVAAITGRLPSTGLGGSGTGQTVTGPPITGSIFAATEGYNLQAVKTSGATVSADDGRQIKLMVAASFGIPDTFFGDSDVGTLATAKSLDRPTELMMEDRQQFWRDITLNITNYVELQAVKAPNGALASMGSVVQVVEDGQYNEIVIWNEGVIDDVSVDFPPILEHDIPDMVSATVEAATLGQAGVLAGTIDLPTLSRILLTQLGIPDANEIVERNFPTGEETAPTTAVAAESKRRPDSEALMVNAILELRNAIKASSDTSTGL